MANRRDFYYRQLVTEAELDASFAGLETAERHISAETLPAGIVTGAVVTQHAPANMTVDVSGSLVAYEKSGQRIAFGPGQNVSVAGDSLGVSTDVAVLGNEKWVSVFLRFDRALSDPRIDGNGDTVYFVRDESFGFLILQGAEAAIGAALRPDLRSDCLLLADVHRVQGQTTIVTADLDITRREDAVARTGSSWSVRRGNLRDALYDVIDAVNAHVDGTGYHSADDVVWTGGGNAWLDGITNPETSVGSQLAKFITDLSSTTASHSGAQRIGTASSSVWKDGTDIAAASVMDAINAIINRLTESSGVGSANGAGKVGCKARTNWLGGRTNAADSVYGAIDKIITDLALTDSADDGAEKIGAQASGAITPYAFTAGSVRSQLDYLITHLNSHSALGDTDKHIVAEGAYEATGVALIESFGAGTPNFASSAVMLTTLANLKTGDVVMIDAHIENINCTDTGGADTRLAVVVNGTTTGLDATRRHFEDDSVGNHYSATARYVMPSDHSCTVVVQSMHVGGTDPDYYGGACVRAFAIR